MLRNLQEQLKTLWNRKRVWIIILAAQILLNVIGQFLPEGLQIVLMASSGAVLLTFSVYAVYSQRGNILVMLLNIMLLYFNYSLVAAVYWNTDSLERIFNGYTWDEFLKCINIELLFLGTYTLLLKDKQKMNKRVYLMRGTPNYLIVAACAAYIAMAPFLFYRTETFGVRGVITPLYEYAIIVMIVGLRFARRDVKAIILLLVASAWLILHGLLHGERILALQMMIVWGVYLLLHILSIKLIIPACIAGIMLFTVFGIYRGLASLEGDAIAVTFKKLLSGGLANNTSYYAYWASMSITRFAETTPFLERLLYFLKYIAYIFLGSAVPEANLSTLSAQVNIHAGGGWLPFYAYFWLSYVGVLMAGCGVALLVNKVSGLMRKKKFCNYLALYVVATAPRWYLYAPATITRGVMFFAAFYYACSMVNKWFPVVLDMAKSKLKQKRGEYDEFEREEEN